MCEPIRKIPWLFFCVHTSPVLKRYITLFENVWGCCLQGSFRKNSRLILEYIGLFRVVLKR